MIVATSGSTLTVVVPVEGVDLEMVERFAAGDLRVALEPGNLDLTAERGDVDVVSLVGALHRDDVGRLVTATGGAERSMFV